MDVPAHLRPLRAQEIVDAGFSVARRVLPRTLLPMALVVVPLGVGLWAAQFAFLSVETDPFSSSIGTPQWNGAFAIATGLVQLFALVVAVAVCTPATLETFSGVSPRTWAHNLRMIARRIPALALIVGAGFFGVVPGGLVIGAIGAVVGFFALVATSFIGAGAIVGAYILVFGALAFLTALFTTAIPALLVENRGGANAIRRSWQLGGSRVFPFTGVMLIVFAIALVAWLALQIALQLLLASQSFGSAAFDSAVSMCMGVAATLLLAPAFAGTSTAMYFDARVRREGLDLAWALRDVS